MAALIFKELIIVALTALSCSFNKKKLLLQQIDKR